MGKALKDKEKRKKNTVPGEGEREEAGMMHQGQVVRSEPDFWQAGGHVPWGRCKGQVLLALVGRGLRSGPGGSSSESTSGVVFKSAVTWEVQGSRY